MILNKFGKPSVYLPGCMVVWGVLSCCTAATQSFSGLLAVRFFLGFVEAAYFVSKPPVFLCSLDGLLIYFSARLPLSPVCLVYKKRISQADRASLRRLVNFRCILGFNLCRYHKWLGWHKRDRSMAMAFHHRGRFDSNISLLSSSVEQLINLSPRSLWLCSRSLLFRIFPERHPG